MANTGSIVRKNLRDLSNSMEMRELNRQLDWVWKKILGGLTSKDFSDGGMKSVVEVVEKTIAEEITADEITANILKVALAEMMVAKIGVAKIDYAQIVDMFAERVFTDVGLAGEFRIDKLQVTQAQIVDLIISSFRLVAEDGKVYKVTVDQNGDLVTEYLYDQDEWFEDGEIPGGYSVVASSLTVGEVTAGKLYVSGTADVMKLTAKTLIADSAWIADLVANTALVEKIWAHEGFIEHLNTADISANGSLQIVVKKAEEAEQKADDAADVANSALEKANDSVAGVDVEYYLSESSVELIGGSWSTLAPQWQNGKYMWSRSVTRYQNGKTPTYSTPVCIAGAKGETGEQGPAGANGQTTYFHVKYSAVENPTDESQMSETPNIFIGTYVDTNRIDSDDPSDYTWYRFQGLQGENGEQGIPGVNGEDGLTSYLHIKYSNDGGKTFTDNNGEEPGDWIGQYVDHISADSTNVADYKWAKIKGETGATGLQGLQGEKGEQGVPGPAGQTTYFHVKYAPVENPTASQMSELPDIYIGTYVDYTYEDSTDPAKYKWARLQGLQGEKGEQGIPGNNGIDGTTSYLHIKYSDDGGKTFTANNGETVGDYIGQYVDNIQTDSSDPNKYKWAKIKGEVGDQGVPGPAGEAGQTSYFHVKYSAVESPTAADITEIPSAYIGTYVDYTYEDSTDPSKYKWARFQGIQGEKGEQGIPGVGIDGKTSYLHIKYSNDGGATFTSNNGETVGDWIGQYVDNTEQDSTNPATYKWAKIKGEVGEQGIQGPAGTSSYFHIKYAPVENPTADLMTETPNLYIGTYVDTIAADSTDPSRYTWYRFQGLQGEKGDQGIPGVGIDGTSSYLHIKYSDNGGLTFTANNGETVGDWIGHRVDETQADSTNPADYTWAKIKGEQGPQGDEGRGVALISEQYYLSTSKTALAGGSWVSKAPEWVEGMYIWIRSEIVYTDGTFEYTDPYLDQSLEIAGDAQNSANAAAKDANDAFNIASEAMKREDFERVLRVDDEGVHVGDNITTCEVLIDSASVNIVLNGTKLSTFSDKFIRFGDMQIRKVTGGLAIGVYQG